MFLICEIEELVVVCPKKGLKAQKQLKDYEIIRDIRDDFFIYKQ